MARTTTRLHVVWSAALCLLLAAPAVWAAWAVPLRPGATASGKAAALFPVPPPPPPKVRVIKYESSSCEGTDNRIVVYWNGQPTSPVKWYLHYYLGGRERSADVSDQVTPPSGRALNAWLFQGPIFLEAVSPDGLSTKGPITSCANP